MIQGMYQAANALSDEAQKALALEVAEGWLAEMQSWPETEYLEEPIVILLEGKELVLYYPYVMDGEETLVPLQAYVDANWTENSEKRYQDGVNIIEEAVGKASLDGAEPGMPEAGAQGSDMAEGQIKEGINHYFIKAFKSDSMVVDEVEWVTDSARAAEIGVDETLPAGFYLYNEVEEQVECFFAESCTFTILDWNNNFEPVQVDRQTFLDTMSERQEKYDSWSGISYILEIADGKIVSVTEQYQP